MKKIRCLLWMVLGLVSVVSASYGEDSNETFSKLSRDIDRINQKTTLLREKYPESVHRFVIDVGGMYSLSDPKGKALLWLLARAYIQNYQAMSGRNPEDEYFVRLRKIFDQYGVDLSVVDDLSSDAMGEWFGQIELLGSEPGPDMHAIFGPHHKIRQKAQLLSDLMETPLPMVWSKDRIKKYWNKNAEELFTGALMSSAGFYSVLFDGGLTIESSIISDEQACLRLKARRKTLARTLLLYRHDDNWRIDTIQSDAWSKSFKRLPKDSDHLCYPLYESSFAGNSSDKKPAPHLSKFKKYNLSAKVPQKWLSKTPPNAQTLALFHIGSPLIAGVTIAVPGNEKISMERIVYEKREAAKKLGARPVRIKLLEIDGNSGMRIDSPGSKEGKEYYFNHNGRAWSIYVIPTNGTRWSDIEVDVEKFLMSFRFSGQ